jgi:membrane protein YdbS with pleckstrin-like domain
VIGLVLIAIGAILVWAVNVGSSAVNLHTVGVILLVVGAVEAFAELVIYDRFYRRFWRSDDDPRNFGP